MEFIHVVPRARLFPEWAPHGFLAFGPEFEQASFLDTVQEFGFFVERAHAERDPSLKQPIPYCVVIQDGKVLLLTRSKKGGEARLHDKLSIGVGGHVEPVDLPTPEELALRPEWSPRNPIPKAARREATEETEVESTNRTGGTHQRRLQPGRRRHVGIVMLCATVGPIRETEEASGRFVTPEELDGSSARART